MAGVKAAELIVICLTLFHGFAADLNCTSPTPVALFDELEKNVFSQKLMRPVETFSNPLNVSVSIIVVGILELDEKSQTLSLVLWQTLEWYIEGLKWDKTKCGTERVSVPRDNLWIPDIMISEVLEEVNSPNTPYVYLYNTGRVSDDHPIKVVTSCQLGIYTFPFDIQNCTLTFGPYLHIDKDVKITQGTTVEEVLMLSRKVLETNGEWELTNVNIGDTTVEIGSAGTYSQISFYITLRRRPFLYVVNLLIPSCSLITVDLFSFMLPPQSMDRSAFKMTLILGYTVFLLIMNDLLPITGEKTPLISVLFSVSLALMVGSLLETLFITSIQSKSSEDKAVPHFLRVLVLRYLAVLVCIPTKERSNWVTVSLNPLHKASSTHTSTSNLSDHESIACVPVKTDSASPVFPEPALDELRKLSRELSAIRLQMDEHFRGTEAAQEWEMIGTVMDRLLFGLYVVFILVSFITIISIWIWNYSMIM